MSTGKIFTGTVVSDKMTGSITVAIKSHRRHPTYQKIITSETKIYADNNLKAQMGDTVKVKETRPLSKMKRFTTLEIVKKHDSVA